MGTKEKFAGLESGATLFEVAEHLDRDALVRYAGAGGDFNAIHYNEAHAKSVGLPNVIAHGMLTMGLAAAALENWLGDPTAVTALGVRFSAMVPVPFPEGNDVTVVGRLGSVEGDTARVELDVTSAGNAVLSKSFADVTLA